MKINRSLSINGCWKMVNAIQNGKSPEDIRTRAAVATEWLNANEIISIEEYGALMNTVAYIVRESYH